MENINKLFNAIEELLFYLDGCVISEKIKEFKIKYKQIRKELKHEKTRNTN